MKKPRYVVVTDDQMKDYSEDDPYMRYAVFDTLTKVRISKYSHSENEAKNQASYLNNKTLRPQKPTRRDFMKTIPAKNGFRGIVSKPTLFLTGEVGTEEVDVTPLDKIFDMQRVFGIRPTFSWGST